MVTDPAGEGVAQSPLDLMKLSVGAMGSKAATAVVSKAADKMADELTGPISAAVISLALAEIVNTTMIKYGIKDVLLTGTRSAALLCVSSAFV